jgi:hypothetical protein
MRHRSELEVSDASSPAGSSCPIADGRARPAPVGDPLIVQADEEPEVKSQGPFPQDEPGLRSKLAEEVRDGEGACDR